MSWNEYGFLVPKAQNDSISNIVRRVCPFNPTPELTVKDEDVLAKEFLASSQKFEPNIGRYENTYIGYSKNFRTTSSSGGIATYVFQQLLRQNIVNHLFVVTADSGSYKYQLFSDSEHITNISGTRYIPVTLEELFDRIDTLPGSVAVSGVACFLKAIRLKQHYHPELKAKIPFLIGIICGGLKSKFFTDYLAQSAGIEGIYRNPEYRIKDENSTASDYSFGAYDNSNRFHRMKMAKVGDMWGSGLFKAKACDFCTDVLTELGDISLGDAWLPEFNSDGMGNSVIITRSALADRLISDGISNGSLNVNQVPSQQVVDSQRASFSHRRDALRYRQVVASKDGCVPPPSREQMLRPVPIHFRLVQMQREVTRSSSFIHWRNLRNSDLFDKKMTRHLFTLHALTKIYHKLRRYF